MVYALFAGIFVINALILFCGFFEVKVITRLLKVPKSFLYPTIFVFAFLGAYSVNNSFFDVVVMLAFGLIGFYMKQNNYSVAILVLGLVLGPIMENNLLRALIKYQNPTMFFSKPLGAILLSMSILFFTLPVINTIRKSLK
jgi:putative tricarboxylic transport membrane protein